MSNKINPKTKVKLIYDTSFDIKLQDKQETISDLARNEVIKCILADKESFFLKLRLKVNDIEIPFLTESNSDSLFEKTVMKQNLKQKQFTEDFNQIFDVLVKENTKRSSLKKNKIVYSNFQGHEDTPLENKIEDNKIEISNFTNDKHISFFSQEKNFKINKHNKHEKYEEKEEDKMKRE